MNVNLTAKQLRHAAHVKDRIDALEAELAALFNSDHKKQRAVHAPISFETRARIAAATRARTARSKTGVDPTALRRPRRRMSAAAKARLAAIARARCRKAKAAGKKSL
ncbi:MAG TPA: hypothetical protein VL361_03490 [Candidatus Limnocylindrales bacterium]|jgi:hypothetical protein|nr:hypothetical protein [Candidatus Limnocylindrales bacterium]